jgi:enoyl-CoA hydratase/carnithine racemase
VIGQGRAFELLLLGDSLDASTAERYGLVNRVVPPEEVLPQAMDWAKRLAAGPTTAISMTKRLINNEWTMDLTAALESEAQAQALMLMGQDHRIFYEAFKEKVEPKFTGR